MHSPKPLGAYFGRSSATVAISITIQEQLANTTPVWLTFPSHYRKARAGGKEKLTKNISVSHYGTLDAYCA